MHENEPAAQVFKNIQIPWLKKTPAERFLRIMNGGYSRALGVQLNAMKNLEDPPGKRFINCSTCHRGAIDPRTTDK